MKIISGKYKGRIIRMPEHIRPTSNKAREALFEILKIKIQGAVFLDLYSGTGAVGIEALSRGAESAVFVDNDFKCIDILKKNLNQLVTLDAYSIDIYKRDVIKTVELFSKKGRRFDIVFLDPPYYRGMAKNTLIALAEYDILTHNALIVAELYKRDFLPIYARDLKKIRTAEYGDTKLEFYSRCSPNEAPDHNRGQHEKNSCLSREF